MKKSIGIQVNPPKKACDDKNCPFHGTLSVRGRIFTGTVVASKVPKMATVEWVRKVRVPKYERLEKRRTKLVVHNPPCIHAKMGDIVKIMECRRLSKSKSFVIIECVGREELIEDILAGRAHADTKKKIEKMAQEADTEKKSETPAPKAQEKKE